MSILNIGGVITSNSRNKLTLKFQELDPAVLQRELIMPFHPSNFHRIIINHAQSKTHQQGRPSYGLI